MIKGKSLLAIILARGGSKRLPNKNILPLAGKPLIAWTIEAAKKSKYIDRIIVSTDSKKIASISKQFGAEVPFVRPKRLATDKATSEDAIKHALQWLFAHEHVRYDYFILLQPTSPLRTVKHINDACRKLARHPSVHALISVSSFEKNPKHIYKKSSNELLYPYLRSLPTESQTLYYPNGSIYIVNAKKFMKSKKIHNTPLLNYVMNEKDSVDIDYKSDLQLASILLKSQ